ncbi:unnamed protein product [Cylicocyclus nassatus]|uniref:Gluconokinase n=1 Tax=Cylicocyclus nassatus TaxID=53992 RepID=A0AA36DJ20_CYLNA|nr:unnamed protein product [Cylicocyclus nassatus]
MEIDAIIVMGVSGCGKTTVGTQIANHLGWIYKDGDDFHSEANIVKMSAGIPLNDEDRRPWLAAINEYCRSHPKVVVGCSALKRKYRDLLRDMRDNVRCKFVFLNVSRKELERRLRLRKDHYMPIHLLDSQLATLEPPSGDENALTVDIIDEASVEAIETLFKRLILTMLPVQASCAENS